MLPDIDECATPSENLCEDTCVNQDRTYSCSCPSGRTLANDGLHCGGEIETIRAL